MTLVRGKKSLWWGLLLTLSSLWVLSPTSAQAGVYFDGFWPDGERSVSLQAEKVTRHKALALLAEQTGWSLTAGDLGQNRLDLSVKQQPAARVLEMILSDGDYVAHRKGNRITINSGPAAMVPISSEPLGVEQAALVSALASWRDNQDRDRSRMGSDLRIEKNERVDDVRVYGGDVDVWGVVKGDLEVKGGDVLLHEGAHVVGDVSVLGGDIKMASNSRVDGDIDSNGGTIERAASAIVGGSMHDSGGAQQRVMASHPEKHTKGWALGSLISKVRGAVTGSILLFFFGAIFWALAKPRMEMLEVEIAKRPMKSLAIGTISMVSALAFAIALTVTILGIPFAVMGIVVTLTVAYVGACVVLSTIGQALLRHRTENRYLHLALGCFLFLLFTAIPYVGNFVWFAVMLTGLGSVVLTRGAGLVPMGHHHPDVGPYRTAAV